MPRSQGGREEVGRIAGLDEPQILCIVTQTHLWEVWTISLVDQGAVWAACSVEKQPCWTAHR